MLKKERVLIIGSIFKIRVDAASLARASTSLGGGYKDATEPEQLNAYYQNYKGTIRAFIEHPRAVIGFYYPVNNQFFPAYIYFVDFVSKGGRRNTDKHYPTTIFEIPIEQTNINIYMFGNVASRNKMVVPITAEAEKLSLEGDFSKFYNLFCVKDQQIEALSLMDPSLMEKILQGFGNASIEIQGNRLYIALGKFLAENDIARAMNNVKPIAEQINHNMKSVTSQNRHDVGPNANYKSLKSGMPKWVIISMLAFIIIWMILFMFGDIRFVKSAGAWVFLALLLAIYVYVSAKRLMLAWEYTKKYGKKGLF